MITQKNPQIYSHGSNSKHSHLIEENNEDHSSSEEHINIRAATIHVLGDLIQSIGVLISSVIIKIRPEYKNADPICTVLFSIIVVATTAKILRDTLNILLESNLESTENYDSIFNDLFNMENVVKVHDLHLWSLTTDQKILTVHLAVDSSIKGKDFSKNYYTTLIFLISLFYFSSKCLTNASFILRFFFKFVSRANNSKMY